jgi:hypothetical protein
VSTSREQKVLKRVVHMSLIMPVEYNHDVSESNCRCVVLEEYNLHSTCRSSGKQARFQLVAQRSTRMDGEGGLLGAALLSVAKRIRRSTSLPSCASRIGSGIRALASSSGGNQSASLGVVYSTG